MEGEYCGAWKGTRGPVLHPFANGLHCLLQGITFALPLWNRLAHILVLRNSMVRVHDGCQCHTTLPSPSPSYTTIPKSHRTIALHTSMPHGTTQSHYSIQPHPAPHKHAVQPHMARRGCGPVRQGLNIQHTQNAARGPGGGDAQWGPRGLGLCMAAPPPSFGLGSSPPARPQKHRHPYQTSCMPCASYPSHRKVCHGKTLSLSGVPMGRQQWNLRGC